MTIQNRNKAENLMDMIPVRSVQWEENRETHLISLLKPKFNLYFFQKRLRQPYYRVNLDQIGTSVWKNIDGKKSVYTIANNLRDQSGEPPIQLYDRVSAFIKSLERNRLIRLTPPIQPDS
jgi:hypothetical protein